MEKLLKVIASLGLTADIKSLLSTIVSDEKVRVAPTKSDNGTEGFNIYGIQCFNKAQLMSNETFKSLNDAIKAESHLNLLVMHGDDYETPLVWIGPSSTNSQSKQDKQSLFA